LFLQVLCGLLNSKLLVCPEINNEELEEEIKEKDIKMNYNIQPADNFERYEYRIQRFYIQNSVFLVKTTKSIYLYH